MNKDDLSKYNHTRSPGKSMTPVVVDLVFELMKQAETMSELVCFIHKQPWSAARAFSNFQGELREKLVENLTDVIMSGTTPEKLDNVMRDGIFEARRMTSTWLDGNPPDEQEKATWLEEHILPPADEHAEGRYYLVTHMGEFFATNTSAMIRMVSLVNAKHGVSYFDGMLDLVGTDEMHKQANKMVDWLVSGPLNMEAYGDEVLGFLSDGVKSVWAAAERFLEDKKNES